MPKNNVFEKLFGKSHKTGYEFTRIAVKPWHNKRYAGIAIEWSAKGIGFGEVLFSMKDGKIEMNTECMSDAFVIALLAQAVPKLIEVTKRVG